MQLRFEVTNKFIESEKRIGATRAKVKDVFLFYFQDNLSTNDLNILKKVLHNSALQDVAVITTDTPIELQKVDLLFLPGMTDNVAESIKSALALTPLKNTKCKVHTGKCYEFLSPTNNFEIEGYNSLLHFMDLTSANSAWKFPARFLNIKNEGATFTEIPVDALKQWIDSNLLALNDIETDVILDYFKNVLKRNPTDVEIEVIAQTWSEHCKHKIFAADYEYSEKQHDAKKIPA
ncbi:MAG: hypothetical protein KDD37_02105, partial [Bdellovibrionales bacterium]|nr:hypothetical protein [Bdellovibrionales bacterium]